ncbi:MAG: hypothetical protein RLZZ175_3365 [Bacteroidota bacterium]|jgi:hypothetical protein
MKEHFKKHWIWYLIGFILLFGAYMYWYLFVSESDIESTSSSTSTSNSQPTIYKNKIGRFPIKKGDKGLEVYQLQKYLNKKFASKLNPDGDWGNATEKAFDNKFDIADRPGYKYAQLTQSLYNQLNLKSIS